MHYSVQYNFKNTHVDRLKITNKKPVCINTIILAIQCVHFTIVVQTNANDFNNSYCSMHTVSSSKIKNEKLYYFDWVHSLYVCVLNQVIIVAVRGIFQPPWCFQQNRKTSRLYVYVICSHVAVSARAGHNKHNHFIA